jgi:hypothetical protein
MSSLSFSVCREVVGSSGFQPFLEVLMTSVGWKDLAAQLSLDEVHVAIMERNIIFLSIVIFRLMQVGSRRLLQTPSGKHNCTRVFFWCFFFFSLFCFGLVLSIWLKIDMMSHVNLL